ncbi:MAG: tetraacyldisaccharide 4'-kinase [Bacteroidales bacterium]|nr:MAG: tetraacyldisaccharide 4'-kinase [Bacteroidales bacterium]
MDLNRMKILRFFLVPFTPVYGFIVGIRNKLFDYQILKSHEFNLPVISLGNITAGGTGKTPHVEYLASLLDGEFRVATLSRGYKRKTKGFIIANLQSSTKDIGDEPKQIKQKFPGIIVAVDSNRVNGVMKLTESFTDLNVIILDDAFQHRYINPGLSILLMDYNRPLSNDHLLPFGNLRESLYEKRRAHIIIVTKCPDKLKPIDRRLVVKDLNLFPYQNLYFTTVIYGEFHPVFKNQNTKLAKTICKTERYHILLVTGIANSRPLKKHLRGVTPKITELKFPDHHDFSLNDIEYIKSVFNEIENNNKIIITTEKDAMRFQDIPDLDEAIKQNLYYIPIGIEFLDDEGDSFNNQIIDYVRTNKRDSILYKK